MSEFVQEAESGSAGAVGEIVQPISYLKFLVVGINKDMDQVGLTRKLTMKDLDKLDHQTFVHLLTYALTCEVFTRDQLLNKHEIMLGLADVGLPRLEYNATLDHIYWAVKRLLPDHDELFTYGLLLNPSSNPKAVKQVLQYIVEFNLFVDGCSEAFYRITEEVDEERLKRAELHRKINEVNQKLEAKAAEQQLKKEVVPSLQTKLNELNFELQAREDGLADLEVELERVKKIYNAEENEKCRLERLLEQLIKKKNEQEAKLVVNHEILQLNYNQEKESLEKLIEKRELVGRELDKLSQDDVTTFKTIKKTEKTITSLEGTMESMVQLEAKDTDHRRLREDVQGLKSKLKGLTTNKMFLDNTAAKLREQVATKAKELRNKSQMAQIKLTSEEEKIIQLKQQIDQQSVQKRDTSAHLKRLNLKKKELEDTISKNFNYLQVEVPKEEEERVQEVQRIRREIDHMFK